MKIERKEIEPKVTHTPESMDIVHNERPPQSTANKAMDK